MLPLCSAKTRPVFTPLVFCFSTVLPLLLASQAWCNGNAEGTEVMLYLLQWLSLCLLLMPSVLMGTRNLSVVGGVWFSEPDLWACGVEDL